MSAVSKRLTSIVAAGAMPSLFRAGTCSMVMQTGLLLQLAGFALGQGSPPPMRQHYEAAFRFQNSGDLSRADSEYKLYLAMILHRFANGNANLGDYSRAAPLYEDGHGLVPGDHDLQMDYAGAALDAGDWRKANSLAASVLESLKSKGQQADLQAVSVLADALLELGQPQDALAQYKVAARLKPGFKTSSALAIAYLVLGDKSNATRTIEEFSKEVPDTASLHLQLGILYGKTKFFDEAIEEFKKAIAKDRGLQNAHYSLGATYMMHVGESAYTKAEAEFREEIALNPENPFVYVTLGQIAMSRHKYSDAEADLKRAVKLNPQNAEAYLILGQVYREMGRIPEAVAAFRKAIDLTLDPSKNGYEAERAHFWLGRLLIQSGSPDEGRKELDVSRNLLYLKEQQVESRLAGSTLFQAPLEKTHEANPEELAALRAAEKEAGPQIASSYDNLGVNAARGGDFAKASSYFEHASHWNPALIGVDENWSRAAFAAGQFGKAVEPLTRILALHPDDGDVRSMLGLSLCITHDYTGALAVLQPTELVLGSNPQLAIAYAGSMALAGDSKQGMDRLKSLEEANPNAALVHYLMGEAYARQGQHENSADELRVALKLDPSNADSKNALARTDLALGLKADALKMLSDLAESGSQDADVYFRLAQLQTELGFAKAAVESLEAAVRIKPMVAAYHQELAEAYRRDAQPEKAEREARQSEALEAQSESNRQSGSRD
jgi:tetratricopeptide (TPR) repeat protein